MKENITNNLSLETLPKPERIPDDGNDSFELLKNMEDIPDMHRLQNVISESVADIKETVPPHKLRAFIEEQGAKAVDFLKEKKRAALSFAKNVGIAYFSIYAIGTVTEHHRPFSERDDAKKELLEYGITQEQRSGYRDFFSEFLYNSIEPTHYPDLAQTKYFVCGVIENNEHVREKSDSASEDGWALYLGLPQKNGTFGISDFKPKYSEYDGYYYTIADREKSKELIYDAARDSAPSHDPHYDEKGNRNPESITNQHSLLGMVKKMKLHPEKPFIVDASGEIGFMLQNFKLSLGEDEHGSYISLYDKYDFSIITEETFGDLSIIGKPFEIYDRFYYDSKTGAFEK